MKNDSNIFMEYACSQFGNPRGLIGRLAGNIKIGSKIIPQLANWVSDGLRSIAPRNNSAIPLRIIIGL